MHTVKKGNLLPSPLRNQYTDGTYAHPTQIIDALGRTTTLTYDTNIGKPSLVKDPNGVQTYYNYVDWTSNQTDPLDRLRLVEYATGTSDQRRTSWAFPNSRTVIQQQDQNSDGDGLLKTTTSYDGFGRPVKTQTADPDGDIYIPNKVITAWDWSA